jgi:tetrapyrrole methylase family protein/MazG family protein
MITVVGVGIKRGDLTLNGKKAIKAADRVFSRAALFVKAENLAKAHAEVFSYDELDDAIVLDLLEAEKSGEKIVYCALGDGFTDSVVKKLGEKTEIEIVAGVSEYRGKSASSTLTVMGAYDLKEDTILDNSVDLMIYGIDDAFVASEIKLKLSSAYFDEQECVFSVGDESFPIKLYELDRMKKYKYSSVFIKGNGELLGKKRYGFNDLMTVMTRLTAPDGCPWDKAQTHESIRINMLEEAYETVDAINLGDIDNLREELGDVLLQVVFHCDMSKRSSEFTLFDVVHELTEKLVNRHTHIFGENKATDALSALGFWEAAKAKEKKYSTLCEQLNRIPDAFPSTLKAQKAIKKTIKSGAKITALDIQEKMKELLSKELTALSAGKLLLLASAVSCLCGVDGEVELSLQTDKFIERAKRAEKNGTLGTDELL